MRMCMVNCTHTKNDSIFFEEQLFSFIYLVILKVKVIKEEGDT